MTNLPHIGDQTIVTNADGSVTISTVTDTKTVTLIRPTFVGWIIILFVIAGIAVIVFRKKRNPE